MNSFVGVGGKARQVSDIYVGVGGLARKVSKAYVGVGDKARQWWPSKKVIEVDPLSVSRGYLGGAGNNNHFFFIGGFNTAIVSNIDIYDKSLIKSVHATGHPIHSGTSFSDNLYLYQAGGKSASGFVKAAYRWSSSLTKMSFSMSNLTSADLASAVLEDHFFLGGGTTTESGTPTNAVTHYLSGGSGQSQHTLSTARSHLAAGNVGEYGVFAGGKSGSTVLGTVDAYNAALTRSNPTALSVNRYGGIAASLSTHLLFAGGFSPNVSSVVDAYNASLTRTIPVSLSVARGFLTGSPLNDEAYFAGGLTSLTPVVCSQVVDIYNSSLSRRTGRSLATARGYHAAAANSQHLLVAGGVLSGGTGYSAVVDVYN